MSTPARHLTTHLTLSAFTHARVAASLWVAGLRQSHKPMTVCVSAWDQWWDDHLDELLRLPAAAVRCLRTSFDATFYASIKRMRDNASAHADRLVAQRN